MYGAGKGVFSLPPGSLDRYDISNSFFTVSHVKKRVDAHVCALFQCELDDIRKQRFLRGFRAQLYDIVKHEYDYIKQHVKRVQRTDKSLHRRVSTKGIPRRPTAYSIFCQHRQLHFTADQNHGNIQAMWRAMSPYHKQQYVVAAARYHRDSTHPLRRCVPSSEANARFTSSSDSDSLATVADDAASVHTVVSQRSELESVRSAGAESDHPESVEPTDVCDTNVEYSSEQHQLL